MPSTTRKAIIKQYKACRDCEENISSYGKCKLGFDNFYFRNGKNNKCDKCQDEIKNWYLRMYL